MTKLRKYTLLFLGIISVINSYAIGNDKPKSSKDIVVNMNKYDDLHSYFTVQSKKILVNYRTNKPVTAELLDTKDPSVKKFLNNELHNNATEPLAVMYYPKFKVDNNETAFCLVYYDSDQNLFKTYEDMKNLSNTEAITYLTWHEMGHCLTKHQGVFPDERRTEELADIFAISLALNNNNKNLAQKIVKQVELTDKSDIHGNGEEVRKFYEEVISKRMFIEKRTINQIIDICTYFLDKGNLDKFKFLEPIGRMESPTAVYVEVKKGVIKKENKDFTTKDKKQYVEVKKEDLKEDKVGKIKLIEQTLPNKTNNVTKKDSDYTIKKNDKIVTIKP